MNKVKESLQVMFLNVRKGDDERFLFSDSPSHCVSHAREYCDQEEGADTETVTMRAEKSRVQIFLLLTH